MKLAFCLFKFFPHGGLQRDFLRILHLCRDRGHECHVYTMEWKGEVASNIHLHLLPGREWQNHTKLEAFTKKITQMLKENDFDLIIGFNKMPNLHLYYAADVCYQARIHAQHNFLHRLLPRFKRLVGLEASVFTRGQSTQIMLISPLQQREFERFYQTEAERFHLLPPGINKDRGLAENSEIIRKNVRDSLNIAEDEFLLLFIGSGFKTKGLDRVIKSLSTLSLDLRSRCHLYIIGDDRAKIFQKLARQLKVHKQIVFLGGRDDIPDFLAAGDLLLHPAKHENTGTVLLEAMIAGLPVLTVDSCGYAHYIAQAQCGVVLPSPFNQDDYNQALGRILTSNQRAFYRKNGLAFAKLTDLYSMPENAVNLIEKMAKNRAIASTRAY